MKKQLALLRGINVSGHKIIKMADLKLAMESSGFSEVKTFIQSGNIIFSSSNSKTVNEQKIKAVIQNHFGYDVGVIVIDEHDLRKVITSSPFSKNEELDRKQLYVAYLSEEPQTEKVDAIDFSQFYPDEFACLGKAIYMKFSESAANSKLTNAFLEKRLGVTATTRNWNTTLKLHELLKE